MKSPSSSSTWMSNPAFERTPQLIFFAVTRPTFLFFYLSPFLNPFCIVKCVPHKGACYSTASSGCCSAHALACKRCGCIICLLAFIYNEITITPITPWYSSFRIVSYHLSLTQPRSPSSALVTYNTVDFPISSPSWAPSVGTAARPAQQVPRSGTATRPSRNTPLPPFPRPSFSPPLLRPPLLPLHLVQHSAPCWLPCGLVDYAARACPQLRW
jgi:hypothetical protein